MTLRGSVTEFPLETIVQLLAATGKTGQLEVRADGDVGALGFDRGRLTAAVMADDSGDTALGAVFALERGDFEFVAWEDPPNANLAGDLNALLDRAVVQRDRIVADRQLIPHDGVHFVLSQRASAQGEVRLSSEQWKVLLAVNGQRDVRSIASYLGLGRLAMLSTLAELVRSGIIEVREGPEPPAPRPAPPRLTDERPAPEPEVAEEPPRAADAHASSETQTVTSVDTSVDDRLSALSGLTAAPPAPDVPQEHPILEGPRLVSTPYLDERPGAEGPVVAPLVTDPLTAPVAPPIVPPPEPKRGMFAGLFKKEQPAAATAPPITAQPTSPRVATLARLANALLDEYSTGEYGKGRIDGRIANLLMRVDEQADPIDHALPVAGGPRARPAGGPPPAPPIPPARRGARDRLDVAALERAGAPDAQVAPYLALLVTQIYEDAERAFGKDKARKGYKAAAAGATAGGGTLGADLRLPRV